MMTISDTDFLYLLLGANALLLGLAAIVLGRLCSRWHRLERFWDSPTAAAFADSAAQQGRDYRQAVQRLEQRIDDLAGRIDAAAAVETKAAPAPERCLPLDNAQRMARNGASVEQLTRTCGLNVGEAKLVQKLYGGAATPTH